MRRGVHFEGVYFDAETNAQIRYKVSVIHMAKTHKFTQFVADLSTINDGGKDTSPWYRCCLSGTGSSL